MAGSAGMIEIAEIHAETVGVWIVGTSPLICNRMSEKARQELLLPKGRKTAADKAAALKHVPIEEYRNSPYVIRDAAAPTLVAMPTGTFKGAMGTAALDLPGARKAQIGRLVFVEPGAAGNLIPIYGEPELMMSVVRSADINHTPDIRSRMVITHWAAYIEIAFITHAIKAQAIYNLIAAAGLTAGVGDWRPEKGKGSFGQFRIANANDAELAQIKLLGNREAQVKAMGDPHPTCFDLETEELLAWYEVEAPKRGFRAADGAATRGLDNDEVEHIAPVMTVDGTATGAPVVRIRPAKADK